MFAKGSEKVLIKEPKDCIRAPPNDRTSPALQTPDFVGLEWGGPNLEWTKKRNCPHWPSQ
jgi:hypothetical protein